MAWTPTQNQTIWAAVSRAVRTPNQGDQNISLVQGVIPGPTVLLQQGQLSATSNIETAYEIGYRIQPKENISLDITAFVNEYKNLDSSANGLGFVGTDPIMGTFTVFNTLNTSNAYGETQGIEAAATWEVTKHIKISGGYSLFEETLDVIGAGTTTANGTAPKQQFNIRSYVDLPHSLQWDTMVYYVDSLPTVGDGFGNTVSIPAYTRLDMRLGWTPMQGVDVSLIGQNLLQAQHQEFTPFLYQNPEEIGRSALAKVTLRF